MPEKKKSDLPQKGDTGLLAHDYGIGSGALSAGTVVQVEDVLEPGTPGTGSHTETVVLLAVWEAGHSLHPETLAAQEAVVVRHLTLHVSDYKTLVVSDAHGAS